MKTRIRPLRVEDAKTSYVWRNDPEIWKYTGSKPDHAIKYEDELIWIKKVLTREDEKRFAIIADGDYVGNIQLTNINNGEASFHIFIGKKNYWGKGIAYEATRQILQFAFDTLKLNSIKLKVRKEHESAIRLYQKVGFHEVSKDKEYLFMSLNKHMK